MMSNKSGHLFVLLGIVVIGYGISLWSIQAAIIFGGVYVVAIGVGDISRGTRS